MSLSASLARSAIYREALKDLRELRTCKGSQALECLRGTGTVWMEQPKDWQTHCGLGRAPSARRHRANSPKMAWAGAGSQSGQWALTEVLEGQDPMPDGRQRKAPSEQRFSVSVTGQPGARNTGRQTKVSVAGAGWLDLQCLGPDLMSGTEASLSEREVTRGF